jgi:hypothetical protein
VIVQVFYNKFTPELAKAVMKVRKTPFVQEVLFCKGERNMMVADNYVVWREGDGDPLDGLYDAKIIERVRASTYPFSG